jgi:small GTP-binding protein
MNAKEFFKFKIVVIGDGGVGKTSLIQKFTHGTFKEDYIKTIGAQFTKLEKEIDGNSISLVFWDIAGQVSFDFLSSLFYKDSQACIIVYSLEENELGYDSFSHIPDWKNEVEKRCGNIPTVLFANKVDLIKEKNLDKTKIQKIVDQINLDNFYITSAKTGEGVNKAFDFLINKLYHKFKTLQ